MQVKQLMRLPKSSVVGDENLIMIFIRPELHLLAIKFLSPVNSCDELKVSFCLEISTM